MAASSGAIRAGAAYVEIFARDGAFQQGMTRIRNQMTQLGTIMRRGGTSMTLTGAAIGAPLVAAMRQASSFQDALNQARTAAGLTAEEVGKVKRAATDLSVAGVGSMSGIAEAMTQLVKAGMPLEQVLAGAGEAVVKFAKNTGVETTRAAEIVQGSMTLFGVSAAEATDTLKAAADASNTDVPRMVQGFSQVAKVAESAGQDMTTTAAALAILSNNMTDGSDAGTSLKTMLQRLRTGAGEADEGLKQLGLSVGSFRDAGGQSLPLGQQMDILKAKLDTVDAIAKDQILYKIFGSDAIRAAEIFLDTGSAGFAKMQENMAKSMTNAEAFDIKMSGISGTFERLQNSVERVSNAVAEAIGGDVLAGFEQGIVGVAGMISRFVAAFPQVAQGAAMLAGGLLVTGAAAIAGGIALQVVGTALRVLQAVLPAIPALFTPVGAALAGVGVGVVGSILAARQLSPVFKEETDAIAAALMRLDLGAAWDLMRVNVAIAMSRISENVFGAFETIKNTAAAAASYIGDKLTEGFDRFFEMFGGDIIGIQSAFQKLGVYSRAAFDWSFANNHMESALAAIDARTAEARGKAPTADARAADRLKKRQEAASNRGDDAAALSAAFKSQQEELAKDHERALKRAQGAAPDSPAQPKQTMQAMMEEQAKQIRAAMDAASASTAMPGQQTAPQTTANVEGHVVEAGGSSIVSAGNWSGIGLDIGSEFKVLEDPAQRTATASEEAAARLAELVGRGSGVNDLYDGQRQQLADQVNSLMGDVGKMNFDVAAGGDVAGLQAKRDELAAAQADLAAFDALRANPAGVAPETRPNIVAMPSATLNPQGAAIEAVAPRAAQLQAVSQQGMDSATGITQLVERMGNGLNNVVAAVDKVAEACGEGNEYLRTIAEKIGSGSELRFT